MSDIYLSVDEEIIVNSDSDIENILDTVKDVMVDEIPDLPNDASVDSIRINEQENLLRGARMEVSVRMSSENQ